jgi:hypothetical protein
MECFSEVTEESLPNLKMRFYGGGNELKVGDKVIGGYTIMYGSFFGHPPSKIRVSDVALALQLFVLNEEEGMLYQLYEKID